MCGRRCRALPNLDVAYNCIFLSFFQQGYDDAHLAAVAALAGHHPLNAAQDVVVIAVVPELLHDARQPPLREAEPLDVGAQVTVFLHRASPFA
jgi:hypothetical protein